MMQKIAAVVGAIPSTRKGGGAITAYSAIEGFLQDGMEVDVVVLYGSEEDNYDNREDLLALGAKVHFLNLEVLGNSSFARKVKNILGLKLVHLFPTLAVSPTVEHKLAEIGPDLLFTYHWEGLAAVYGISEYIKIGLVGDPIHLPTRFRNSLYSRLDSPLGVKQRIINFYTDVFVVKRQIKGMVALLNDCEIKGAFASHHADEFSQMGVNDCLYVRTPVPEVQPCTLDPGRRFKIVLIGHLVGIATLSGLEIFIKEIYPRVEQQVGRENFEVHLVGGFFDTMPKSFKDGLTKQNIVIRGQVSPADNEFLSADVVLVPTPIDLGIRVRIITAFSFGSLIVAHSANEKGIPELVSGYNSLTGSNGKQLAEQIINVFNETVNVKEIKSNSRKTYERFFTPNFFAKHMSEKVRGYF